MHAPAAGDGVIISAAAGFDLGAVGTATFSGAIYCLSATNTPAIESMKNNAIPATAITDFFSKPNIVLAFLSARGVEVIMGLGAFFPLKTLMYCFLLGAGGLMLALIIFYGVGSVSHG